MSTASRPAAKILIVGESVFKIYTHYKGFAAYETGYITMSLEPFIDRFGGTGLEIDFMPNHEVSLKFPFSIAEMDHWDAIVISDAPADSFLLAPDTLAGKVMPNRLRLLCDWVKGGRGFAMIGGWMSFGGFHGKAHWAFSPITDLVPAGILPHDDRVEVPEGVVPILKGDHPILRGLPDAWPDFLGYNRLMAPTGETLLSFPNGDPLLVTGSYGAGRTAVFTSDILPHWGSPRFLDWSGYLPFWTNFFYWVAGKALPHPG